LAARELSCEGIKEFKFLHVPGGRWATLRAETTVDAKIFVFYHDAPGLGQHFGRIQVLFQIQGWNALFAPKGTPDAILGKLNSALRTAVASEAFQKRMQELGALPASGEELTPEYIQKLVPAEIEKFRGLLGSS